MNITVQMITYVPNNNYNPSLYEFYSYIFINGFFSYYFNHNY
jgi:hypothetical protein